MADPFEPPSSIAEALERRAQLVTETLSIQAQLADRDKSIDGRRMTDIEYHQWRTRAVFALNAKHAEIARIKAYLSTQSMAVHQPRPATDPAEPITRDTFFDAIRLACDSHKSMLQEVMRLQAEVERLRDTLGRISRPPASPDGHNAAPRSIHADGSDAQLDRSI